MTAAADWIARRKALADAATLPRLALVSFARGAAWGLLAIGAYLAGAVLAEKCRRWWA